MVKEDLVQRSPVRVLMKALGGGLKPGELGVIAAPSGTGKTSVLVQIALDKLIQGSKVIHVSFAQHTDYVLTWYNNIFDEFLRKKNLEAGQEVRNEITKNRVLMKFNQDGLAVDQILRSLRAMIKDGSFTAEYIIVDGYFFTVQDRENVLKFREFGKELGLSLWFSCNVKDESFFDKRKIPVVIAEYADLFDVIAVLEPKNAVKSNISADLRISGEPSYIDLVFPRNRDVYYPLQPALRLDPRTLLLLEE